MKKTTFIFILSICYLAGIAQLPGSFKDMRDGKTYKTVTIGSQTWMAENLAYKPSSGNYWAYDNNSSNVTTYGYLYDWETAKSACPSGWRLPTKEEFEILLINAGGDGNAAFKGLVAGGVGFSALLGGTCDNKGNFSSLNAYTFFWSATVYDITNAWFLYLNGGSKTATCFNMGNKVLGFSARCVKN